MSNLALVYFDGCPNAPRMREALLQTGHAFEEVRQNQLDATDPRRKLTSPAILRNGNLLFGAPASAQGGCTLVIPTSDEINSKLGSPDP